MPNQISLRGVRVHNLKNVDVDIPRDKLVVLTGLCNMLLGRFMDSSWALIISTLLCAFLGVFFIEDKPGEEESE